MPPKGRPQNRPIRESLKEGWAGFDASFHPWQIDEDTWELAGFRVVRLNTMWWSTGARFGRPNIEQAFQDIKVYYYSLALMVERLERANKKTKTLSR